MRDAGEASQKSRGLSHCEKSWRQVPKAPTAKLETSGSQVKNLRDIGDRQVGDKRKKSGEQVRHKRKLAQGIWRQTENKCQSMRTKLMPGWEVVGDKWEGRVKSCGPEHTRHTWRQWETSGRRVGYKWKCKIRQRRARAAFERQWEKSGSQG